MRLPKPKPVLICAIALGFWGLAYSGFAKSRQMPNNNFDFYVLALSWSPSYCLGDGANGRGGSQCRIGARHGFVVHGLWPQYEHGFPRNCPAIHSAPSSGIVSSMQDIMPSRRLVEIAWARHGTCSGLSVPEYFALLRRAYNNIKMPVIENQHRKNAGAIEQSFIAINPNLNIRRIAVIERSGRISEVRICVNKSLEFRDCPQIDSRGAADGQNLSIPQRQ